MPDNLNHYFTLFLITLVFLVGLASFIGGIQSKQNPFFWLKDYKSIYLKTPTHYVLFGLVSMLSATFFAYRTLVLMGAF